MQGEQQAIMRLVPLATASTLNQAAKTTALTGSASAAQLIPGTSANPQNVSLVWITLAPAVNIRIAFGVSTVSAATTDRLVFGGAETDYCVPPGITHFSARADTTAGELSWHVSSP